MDNNLNRVYNIQSMSVARKIETLADKLKYYVVVAQGVRLDNPIQSGTFEELVTGIARWVGRIAIPIAVIVIIIAGIKFMIAKGDITKVAEAKKMLLYAVVGLAIVFIGGGFVSLIQSILELR